MKWQSCDLIPPLTLTGEKALSTTPETGVYQIPVTSLGNQFGASLYDMPWNKQGGILTGNGKVCIQYTNSKMLV
jgi:hypothetical protein